VTTNASQRVLAANQPAAAVSLDILIPTYNRSGDLARNLRLLNRLLAEEGGDGRYRILISDNCSTDDTPDVIDSLWEESEVELIVFRQRENLGGEGNVVFLIQKASAERVMIVGDDDFLPPGYLTEVLRLLGRHPGTRAIVPGIASLYSDGRVVPERNERFDVKRYPMGRASVRAISYLGHQISGIVFLREGMLDAYLERPELRNIYPTVFFLGYSCERGEVIYVPRIKILISQDNTKYWRYDPSGLLSQIFSNYRILYPTQPLVRLSMCVTVMFRQPTRLGFGMNPLRAVHAFFHLLFAPGVDPLVRATLPVVFPVLYLRRILRYMLRRLGWLG